ncbi:hypothetical protein [Rubidibacter lacunae]|nr:hypothetical protein [Rubidibacter lacunae]
MDPLWAVERLGGEQLTIIRMNSIQEYVLATRSPCQSTLGNDRLTSLY